jgi:xanthine dehydrogenase accessory factor
MMILAVRMAPAFCDLTVLVRGGGEVATGIAHRLNRCHMNVVITEIDKPTAVRRSVSFAEAVYDATQIVEGVKAVRVDSVNEIRSMWERHDVPLVVDADAELRKLLNPLVLVNAIMAKKSGKTATTDAPLVIGVGPGFSAGVDVHAVIESNRGYNLGRVIWEGAAESDTGEPAPVNGFSHDRVLRIPRSGTFRAVRAIGDLVKRDEVIGEVNGDPIVAQISGQIRGLLRNGIQVQQGTKAGDIDPRGERGYCYSISDKARAIAGGVLEAILHFHKQ